MVPHTANSWNYPLFRTSSFMVVKDYVSQVIRTPVPGNVNIDEVWAWFTNFAVSAKTYGLRAGETFKSAGQVQGNGWDVGAVFELTSWQRKRTSGTRNHSAREYTETHIRSYKVLFFDPRSWTVVLETTNKVNGGMLVLHVGGNTNASVEIKISFVPKYNSLDTIETQISLKNYDLEASNQRTFACSAMCLLCPCTWCPFLCILCFSGGQLCPTQQDMQGQQDAQSTGLGKQLSLAIQAELSKGPHTGGVQMVPLSPMVVPVVSNFNSQPSAPQPDDPMLMIKYKQLLDAGVMTQSEYEQKKRELLKI